MLFDGSDSSCSFSNQMNIVNDLSFNCWFDNLNVNQNSRIVLLGYATQCWNIPDGFFEQKIPGIQGFEIMSTSYFPLVLEQKLIFCKTLEIAGPGKGLETLLQRILDNSFSF